MILLQIPYIYKTFVVLGRHLLLVDDVDAGLVERYGIGRGDDAIVLQLHGLGMIHAIAVY